MADPTIPAPMTVTFICLLEEPIDIKTSDGVGIRPYYHVFSEQDSRGVMLALVMNQGSEISGMVIRRLSINNYKTETIYTKRFTGFISWSIFHIKLNIGIGLPNGLVI